MKPRSAFTLFELILAIALSATLLALIGTAINLYLVRMDSSRTRVEEAQLARSILSTIAADVRAATVHQTQDISTVTELAAGAAVFDPDAIDQAGTFGSSALGSPGTTGTSGSLTSLGDAAASMSSGSNETGGMSVDGSQTSTTTTAPGLNGLVNELMLDVARLPRLDELFPTVPQQASSANSAATIENVPRPSDLKLVRYFVRQGMAIDPSDLATTSLSAQANQSVGGLVRQTVDRAVRETAELSGNSQLLNSGQVLLAPEVTQIQFLYFDGTTAVDVWDMQERGSMPTAVEVRVWFAPDAIEAQESSVPLEPRMYSQTIDLPLAQSSGASASTTATDEESTNEEESTEEEDTGGIGQNPGFGP